MRAQPVAASARASVLEMVDAGIGVKRWLALFLFGITCWRWPGHCPGRAIGRELPEFTYY